MHKLKGWRTLALNIAAAIPLLWDVFVIVMQSPELGQIIPEHWRPHYAAALPLMNIVLRVITTTPVGRAR